MKVTILFLTLLCLQSCKVVNKLFHKTTSQIDSSYVAKQKLDSLIKTTSSSLQKEDITNFTKWDSAKTNEETVITEQTTIKEFTDSGNVKKETVIEKKTEIKKGGLSGSLTVFENAGKIDSNEFKKTVQLSKQSEGEGQVRKKEKEVVKEVHKKSLLKWWQWILLWLIMALIGWSIGRKYKEPIKGFFSKVSAFVVHLFTGL